jgi:hypothetical protein
MRCWNCFRALIRTPQIYWNKEVLGCPEISDEMFKWVLLMFNTCMELAAVLDKEHHDRWHPIVWFLAQQLRHEAEEWALEKARARR